jgi:hypothetical protein
MLKSILRPIQQQPEVTICIPAWRAEAFIDRTLRCAQEQTERNLRILTSIDLCDDATAEICHAHARADRRIEVLEQRERLGWARNVNALLDRVETEFYFLYFHDDIIAPAYTARLLEKLRARSDAASAHCDMGHFGASEHVSIGRDYEGGPVERLCTFLLAPTRGSPLRSLTRTIAGGSGLRLPTDAPGGFWANEPYLMRLLAAGPALRVPEALYKRWDKREGGLTDGWKHLTREEVTAGLRANTATTLALIDSIPADEGEREVLRFAAYIFMLRTLAQRTRGFPGSVAPIEPRELSPAFADMRTPPALSTLSPEIQHWARSGYAHVQQLRAAATASDPARRSAG